MNSSHIPHPHLHRPVHTSKPTHRKRISVSRLSSDTASTLPEYSSPRSPRSPSWSQRQDPPSDRPPDYPETDSAEEGDADTEEDTAEVSQTQAAATRYTSHHHQQRSLQLQLPRRGRRTLQQGHRKQSASTSQIDSSLDALLARSVAALEMSNELLQQSGTPAPSSSSMSPRLLPTAEDDRETDTFSDMDSIGGSGSGRSMSRAALRRELHAPWMDDMAEIERGIERLFGGESRGSRGATRTSTPPNSAGAVSKSLPASSIDGYFEFRPTIRTPKRANTSDSVGPSLHLSTGVRSELVSPPPRALTMYLDSNDDPEAITLPSTIGIRGPSSTFPADTSMRHTPSSSNLRIGIHPSASASVPMLTDRPIEPATPAYNLLSSFVARAPSSGSTTPSASFTSSVLSSLRRRSSGSTERTSPTTKRFAPQSPDRTYLPRRTSLSRSRSVTPRRSSTPPPVPRPMTPPIEELSASSGSGSSSSDAKPLGYRTAQSLQRILDKQPAPPPKPRTEFMPRTPAPTPVTGSSTATASVSRLLTKGTHRMTARAPSPPRRSALKSPSAPNSAPPTPTMSVMHTPRDSMGSLSTLGIPDLLTLGLGRRSASSSSSSTPKRISFAALPEAHTSTSGRFEKGRKRTKKKGTVDAGETEGEAGWWRKWLLPPSGGVGGVRHEERVEERIARGWGRAGMGSLDEFTV